MILILVMGEFIQDSPLPNDEADIWRTQYWDDYSENGRTISNDKTAILCGYSMLLISGKKN